jgi:cell division inhibitor SulA
MPKFDDLAEYAAAALIGAADSGDHAAFVYRLGHADAHARP